MQSLPQHVHHLQTGCSLLDEHTSHRCGLVQVSPPSACMPQVLADLESGVGQHLLFERPSRPRSLTDCPRLARSTLDRGMIHHPAMWEEPLTRG